MYVSNRLREQAEAVWRCIGENNGHFYVCGDAGKMAKGGRGSTLLLSLLMLYRLNRLQ